jgi:hypothetical protein
MAPVLGPMLERMVKSLHLHSSITGLARRGSMPFGGRVFVCIGAAIGVPQANG